MTSEESKTCPDCKQDKPLGEFYVDRRAKTGRTTYCKLCFDVRNRESRRKNPERARARNRAWDARNREHRREITRRWQRENREQYLAIKKRNREANRDKIAEYWREYYEVNREAILTQRREWARANPDKKRAARDPAKMRQDRERRRARELDAFVADVLLDAIILRDQGLCGICSEPITGNDDPLELDHIIPLAAGGTHEPDNVQLAHRSCNRRKGTTLAA